MDKNKFEIIRLRMERTAEALRKNNMYCECVDSAEEALEVVESLIKNGEVVNRAKIGISYFAIDSVTAEITAAIIRMIIIGSLS